MTVGSTSGQIFDECHHSSSPPHCGRYPKHGGEDRWSRRRPRRLESFPRQPKCARVCPPPASVARARVGAALLGDTTPETINQLTETPKPTTTFVARTQVVVTLLGDTTPKNHQPTYRDSKTNSPTNTFIPPNCGTTSRPTTHLFKGEKELFDGGGVQHPLPTDRANNRPHQSIQVRRQRLKTSHCSR